MADEVEEQTPAPEQVEAPPAGAPEPQQFDYRSAYENMQRQLATVVNHLMAQQQRPAAPEPPRGPQSDEDLWARAQQGDRAAFEEWQERGVERKFNERFQQQTRHQATVAQIGSLYQKYPEFNDPSHELTRKANQFYSVLTQMGEPQGPATQLQAMLRAAADSREIVAAPASRPIASRPSAAGQLGVTHRAPASPEPQARLSKRESEIAARMGVKDPGKSKDRFFKRQEEGRSSVHHSIATYLDKDASNG